MEFADPPNVRPTLRGSRHMIVAGHPLAAMAGMRILEAGGNAIDAGVAAGFALNVVQHDLCSVGGVAPIVVYRAETGLVATISGIGRWPKAATRDRVAALGGGRIRGHARWVVPAAADAWLAALARYGSMSAADVLGPAIELADDGFPGDYFICHNLDQARAMLERSPDGREAFLSNGRTPRPGEIIRQRTLGDTLRILAEAERARGGSRIEGIAAARDAFYKGEIAERIAAFAQAEGGLLVREDITNFAVREEPPVSVDYRGNRVFGCGPWSQGPALLQMLNLLEPFALADLSEAERAHLLIECVKLGLAERNRWYGDPDFVSVPIEKLLSKAHADELRALLDLAPPRGAGGEPAAAIKLSPDTTYVCVVDAAGNAFSATPSDSSLLLGPMVPGLGFAISNRGLQSSLDPDNPNSVEPGKRPRLTPNPAIVVGPDFVMPFGSPGGEVQTQAMLQVLINHLDLGMDLQAAVEARRWASYHVPATEDPHPSRPGLLRLEASAPEDLFVGLAERGHIVEGWPAMAALAGGVCAIRREADGRLTGAADPRRMSYGIGW